MSPRQASPDNLRLFGPDVPDGFQFRPDFLNADEEAVLLGHIQDTKFSNFEMRGVVARRRVAFFGLSYDLSTEAPRAIPEFLLPVRARVAAWAAVAPEAFVMALINEYRPGAPIGWHRDAPQYDVIAGISLLSECQMRFRPYVAPRALRSHDRGARRTTTHEITLIPRSAYLIDGAARREYEHSIPAVHTLRYSITFRTLR
ncbi:MAG: alpha-ketoglutarate-dependent dioxygenase AlkB [Acidobacteriota bacterium]